MPSDLTHVDAGVQVSVDVGNVTTSVKLGPILKVSLRTRDIGEARLRHASVQQQFERRWVGMRSAATELSHRDIVALAGWWYRDLVANCEAEPGDAEGWGVYQDWLTEVRELLDSDGSVRPAYDPDRGMTLLARRIDVGDFLTRRGLQLDRATRIALCREIARALWEAAETLKRRSGGDYGPDKAIRRFPTLPAQLHGAPARHGAEPRFAALIDGWAKESAPKEATLSLWRTYLTSFSQFIGHDNALV